MGFSKFNLPAEVNKGINDLGFRQPTPVQAQVIPNALKGNDIRACAQTGTGKTCAFVIPLLDKIVRMGSSHKPVALVVVPTRELGAQVISVIKDVGRFTKVRSVLIMGGVDIDRQVRQIRAGVDIVVATPGRLLDHINRRTLTIKKIQFLILDEADRMLDMGFLPDIKRIISACPTKRQTMLFSATFPPEILKLVDRFLKKPIVVDLAPSQPAQNVTQVLYPVSRSQKEAFVKAVLKDDGYTSALIFCRTKHGSDHLAGLLKQTGKKVTVIHSNLSQSQRDKALEGFKTRRFQILVATDIAARGIDIKDISHVINYDVPHNPEDYVHRIGRTGRAEATGDAITLMAPDEETYISRIERMIGKTIERKMLPNFPYLVPPRLSPKSKSVSESFGKIRSRIPTSRSGRYRRK